MERIDDLGIGGLRLLQDTDLFCFGTDSVLLSDFVCAGARDTVVDLCTGNGIIPVLLSAKTKAKKIYGIEILKESFALAVRNTKLNSLSEKVEFINDDIKNKDKYFSSGSIEVVTCNPPYIKVGAGFTNPDDLKAAARHELYADLDSVVSCAAWLLKFGGSFYIVHRADRMCDVLCTMRKYKIEPKRLTLVSHSPYHEPSLVMVAGMRGAKPSLKFEKTIYAGIHGGE